jgi:hypothetical protein
VQDGFGLVVVAGDGTPSEIELLVKQNRIFKK